MSTTLPCAICYGHHSHWMSCATHASLRETGSAQEGTIGFPCAQCGTPYARCPPRDGSRCCDYCEATIASHHPPFADLPDVPRVTNDQLRHIWGWLNSCPGERPLSAALEQALASARRELPNPQTSD